MKMESVVPFILMVIQQLAQVGLMVASQVTTSAGLSTFTFLFYSSALSTLILTPLSFVLHRSALPPLWTTFIHGFFLLGITGFLMQVFTLIGLLHSSPLLSTSILQLVPGFTFIFAVLRMEAFDYKSLSTLAKIIGTFVSIIGALVATLYKGPQVLNATLTSLPNFLNQPSSWVIGGLVAMIGAIITSLFIISQAFVLKKYQAEMVVMLFYSCGITVFCLVSSLITARDLSSWIINSHAGILALMYSAVFGSVFQVCINSWVVKRRGPLFVVMFHPLGIVFAMAASLFMGETIHIGSLVGSVIIVVGFYSLIWGKAKEWEKEKMGLGSNNNNNKIPLLQDKLDDPEVNLVVYHVLLKCLEQKFLLNKNFCSK